MKICWRITLDIYAYALLQILLEIIGQTFERFFVIQEFRSGLQLLFYNFLFQMFVLSKKKNINLITGSKEK